LTPGIGTPPHGSAPPAGRGRPSPRGHEVGRGRACAPTHTFPHRAFRSRQYSWGTTTVSPSATSGARSPQ
jgi:hypothetical protein